MYTQCVALLALYVGLANCFSWDVVLRGPTGLNFYSNGTLTHSEDIASYHVSSTIIYDPVHNRVLFVFFDKSYRPVISGFDLATKKVQSLVSCQSTSFSLNFAYDPVTETLFWVEVGDIYSFSLKSGSNNTVNGNSLIKLDHSLTGIAVDSCGGFVYWITNIQIERARFDGSEREVLEDRFVYYRADLVIDQQMQKMYWIENYVDHYIFHFSIESADLNGKNVKTLYRGRTQSAAGTISVSKDFIYWRLYGQEDILWKLPKNPPYDGTEPQKFSICHACDSVAAKYQVEDLTGPPNCAALKSLLQNIPSNVSTDVSRLCVHGTQVIGESVCNCTQGYTGDRCDVSLCQNYCLHGDCSVSDEQPKCRCNAGYSGERCEVNACQGYCLNDGVCSLNADGEPVCHCTGDYEGDRCEVSVSVFFIKCFRIAPTLSTLRDILDTDVAPVTLDKQVLQLMSESSGACSLNEP